MTCELTAIIQWAIGLGALATGWVLGFWHARWLQRRLEINAQLDLVRAVVRPIASASEPPSGPTGRISADALHKLQVLMWRHRWRRLDRAVQAYHAACSQCHTDEIGQPHLTDPAALQAAAKQVLAAAGHHR